jgi:putative DNA methylase
MPSQEVITRRNLPHWYVPGAAHFVTYRLADTIPVEVLRLWREETEAAIRRFGPEGRSRAHKLYFARMDKYLDQQDKAWLATPTVAAMIRGNLYHHDGTLYHLLAYCIMPNHVHVLLQPTWTIEQPVEGVDEPVGERADARSPLSRIMHSLKSYTANEANKLLRRRGRFWQAESYDHWVRDDDELERIVAYIANNPVKAKLVSRPCDWYFCSAHDRFLTDGSEEGWLTLPRLPEELVRPS